MNRTKRILGIFLCVVVLGATAAPVFGQTAQPATKNATVKALAYVRPDITILLKGEPQGFFDVDGKRVYPVLYNGSTYLPIRAVSKLMGEDVEWDNYSKTIFLGKTLTNPNKSKSKQEIIGEATPYPGPGKGKTELVSVYIRKNFTVMYDFRVEMFSDEGGVQIYPLVYNGSAYLPIRAISGLMGQEITWDGKTKTVAIGIKEEPKEEPEPIRQETLLLTELFQQQVELYDNATAKIARLQAAKTQEELDLLSKGISADSLEAQQKTLNLKAMDTTGYTEAELASWEALCAFAQSSEYYILVMENIAYMAAAQTDYSMMAETFLTFALESSAKLDSARAAIKALQK